ncbi:MAG: CPBP family intramembrane metalloprotease [Leptospiraceae bacterium]|nr:CPBP family intramembrane metalloprotease [Leptospiraceae bacterium]MDW7975060.1 CPBP family intramembrane glutamic endopeptidase [Leptospiraceae bacterium]
MNSNKKIAAILWFLLPRSIQKTIEPLLSESEKDLLRNLYKEIQTLPYEEKKSLEYKLHFIFCYPYKNVFYLVFLVLLVLFVFGLFFYILRYPNASPFFIFSLFWPALMGIFSFVFLSSLTSFEIYRLFSFPKKITYFLFFLLNVYLQIFILILINQFEGIQPTFLSEFEKWILGIGVISAPITEEILFRHKIPEAFGSDFFRNIMGHMISNFIFSILHLPAQWEQGILYFFSGMFFSFLKLYTENLLLPILSHSLTNFVVFFFF